MIDYSDIFSVTSANKTIIDSQNESEPRKLWNNFWIEHEVCCLFADAKVGKSILAVQIADKVARFLNKDESVLYYDFELSKKQFGLRYSNQNDVYQFPSNFYRIEMNVKSIDDACMNNKINFEDVIMHGIEANIKAYNGKAVIIDNISWLLNMKDSPTMAGKLMKNLCTLKQAYDISILVLAHTPKRNLGTPLTQNSLSGSKKFTNFFDSMFAIGASLASPSIRYVKQIKVRTGEFKHDENHVCLYQIEKDGCFLKFKYKGMSSEHAQLTRKNNNKAVKRSSLSRSACDYIQSLAAHNIQKINKRGR